MPRTILFFMAVALSIAVVAEAQRFTATIPEAPAARVSGSSIVSLPRSYVCMRAAVTPVIDGRIEDEAWSAAAWTAEFTDIEGDLRPEPPLRTRVRMLWDDEYLYIAAQLEEPHVWGTLTDRDAVIFHDDDFEVFIDPDGDTHQYYELEINALGTVWDLFLVKPYRDGGPPIDAWDIVGLKSAVHVEGTVNDARDVDRGWTVELALPWNVLEEAAREGRPPLAGETWRINFSRVDWDVDVVDGRTYAKRVDPATGRPWPEHNWVWSPQGVIDMHRPELWGMVQFSDRTAGDAMPEFVMPPGEAVRAALREVYYAERAYHDRTGSFAGGIRELGLPDDLIARLPGLTIAVTALGWEAVAQGPEEGTVWIIREDGRLIPKR